MVSNPLGALIRARLAAKNVSQRDFAAHVGVTPQAVTKWLGGGGIENEKLPLVAEFLGVKIADLIESAIGSGGGGLVAIGDTPGDYNDFAMVPLYNVKAAAGAGSVVTSERVVDTLAFRADFLRHELNAGKDDLYLIHVEGDSMEPTLRAGDVILVDHRRSQPDREGIYVIRMEDALLVKRIQLQPGGKVIASSDNASYKAFELKRNDAVAVIGRVVWAGRRF